MDLNSFLHKLSLMTVYNPIFSIVLISAIWFIPGILIRRMAERRSATLKKKSQEEKLERLYPKTK